jgi:rSAM/selenodomain-associated transferase 2
VIVPVFDEADGINGTIGALKELNKNGDGFTEIIVVDGHPEGNTVKCIEDEDVITLKSAKGRSVQMNAGAKRAKGDILLFLHADTFMPEQGFQKIKETMANGAYVGGAFNYDTTGLNWFMKHIYLTSWLRSRLTRIAYGDQAIFMRKDYFEQLGGYPEVPLMEEIELMKQIKKNKYKIHILPDKVKTSARRYDEEGHVFGWLRNHKIRFLYWLGVPLEKLTKLYPDTRRRG